MGFFEAFSGAVNYAAEGGFEKWMDNYKSRLRNASDSQVQAKWDEVCSNYDLDERVREATEKEMRRRGLL